VLVRAPPVTVKLDVAERTLALSVRGARIPAGGLPAVTRRSRVLAERVGRRNRAGEATHSLLANIVVARSYGTGHGHASFESYHDIVARYLRLAVVHPLSDGCPQRIR
jgi:hypothetical protein